MRPQGDGEDAVPTGERCQRPGYPESRKAPRAAQPRLVVVVHDQEDGDEEHDSFVGV